MKINSRVFLLTILLYFFLLFSPNNKIMVFLFAVYFLALLKTGWKIRLALLITYLAGLPFQAGKTLLFEFVSKEALGIPDWFAGIEALFVISVKDIAVALMGIMLIRDALVAKKWIFRRDAISLLLLLYGVFIVVASAIGSIRPNISLLFGLYELEPLVLYLYLWHVSGQKKSLFSAAVAVFAAAMFLEFVHASSQLMEFTKLGPSMEHSSGFIMTEQDRELGPFFFRPAGTLFHANLLARYILPYIFIFLPHAFFPAGDKKTIGIPALLLSVCVLILSLSRAAWVAFGVSFLVLLIIAERVWKYKLRLAPIKNRVAVWGSIALFVMLVSLVFPRALSSIYFFDKQGGAKLRIQLLSESWKVIKSNVLWGVGLEMDVYYSFSASTRGSIYRQSPYPVFNGFVRMWEQSGIFPLVMLLCLTMVVLRIFIKRIVYEKSRVNRFVALSVAIGLMSLYINACVHPQPPNLLDVVLLTFLYGYKG